MREESRCSCQSSLHRHEAGGGERRLCLACSLLTPARPPPGGWICRPRWQGKDGGGGLSHVPPPSKTTNSPKRIRGGGGAPRRKERFLKGENLREGGGSAPPQS